MNAQCCDNPRFFYCECVGVESEGAVFVISLCTSCGQAKSTKITVSSKGAQLRLLAEEKKVKQN